ncbi:MAG: MAPEG family protein [Bdellovibrionota bacterium]
MRSAPYFAAIGFLTIAHAIRVIRLRRKHRVAFGDGGVNELLIATRVFGNHAEYAPIGLIMLLALEFVLAPAWCLHLAGSMLVLGRIIHATGLPRGIMKFRVAGMILTFASIAVASLGIFVFSIT